jgi:hypothetical protein
VVVVVIVVVIVAVRVLVVVVPVLRAEAALGAVLVEEMTHVIGAFLARVQEDR